MKILIKNGRLVDPASGLDQVGDLAITASRITALGNVSADFEPDRVIDATGLIVAPGLVDLAVRLREPGHEHEGMLESELAAAAAGGVTSVVCLPDTDPALDEPGLVEMLKLRARKLSRCRLFPLGALTRGLKGENLTEMAELHEAGCVGYSQAESPIKDTQVLQRAMQYASTFGYTVWLRPLDPWLGKGVAASGAVATRLGLSGVPVSAETIAIHTIVELVKVTGARVHLCRISSAAGVELVRQAKAQGLPITADVSINSLMLTDVDIGYFNSSMRVTPPLRQGRDRDALRAGLADGTLDALVSDHNPVSEDEKMLPFGEATPGATGVELLLSLAMKWSGADQQDQPAADKLRQALSVVTQGPVKVLGDALGSLTHSAGRLVAGGVADIVMFDPAARWQVQPSALVSQGKHTPFAFEATGFELAGRVRLTLVAGQVAHDAQDRAEA
ncbi:MAG: dihydroorotase [Aquabacterium sp.]|jgi:dihydroorotase|uniref:dihydroorotase n=1 Tax=Aquabacterium sp. TaxID=1872578 RepID=UPI002A3639DC|nr:dihydroorotase [Aquabacterium sp.]MDX9843019.1 dihydroorotase [Aquabacterium sp.]